MICHIFSDILYNLFNLIQRSLISSHNNDKMLLLSLHNDNFLCISKAYMLRSSDCSFNLFSLINYLAHYCVVENFNILNLKYLGNISSFASEFLEICEEIFPRYWQLIIKNIWLCWICHHNSPSSYGQRFVLDSRVHFHWLSCNYI